MQKLLFKCLTLPAIILFLFASCNSNSSKVPKNVDSPENQSTFKLIEYPAEKKVDIWVGDDLFTSYIYPENIAKPVLYPLLTSSGKVISRSFPLDIVAGERIDHPHHVGLWMNYGDVNGLDFWNNSEAIPNKDKHLYGTIYHKDIVSTESTEESGVLKVTNEWKSPNGEVLLDETTIFTFSVEGTTRIIERATTLKALTDVSFKDNKEGMLGVRVARSLELPTEEALVFTDSHGNPTETEILDNTGVNGNYLSSEGLQGNDVWGTRARWVDLYSTINDEPVGLTIIDHPKNVGYPTYWHARDYGLFAANPLGQAIFSEGKNVLDFKLAANEEVTFKFQILIHSGTVLSAKDINSMADKFAKH